MAMDRALAGFHMDTELSQFLLEHILSRAKVDITVNDQVKAMNRRILLEGKGTDCVLQSHGAVWQIHRAFAEESSPLICAKLSELARETATTSKSRIPVLCFPQFNPFILDMVIEHWYLRSYEIPHDRETRYCTLHPDAQVIMEISDYSDLEIHILVYEAAKFFEDKPMQQNVIVNIRNCLLSDCEPSDLFKALDKVYGWMGTPTAEDSTLRMAILTEAIRHYKTIYRSDEHLPRLLDLFRQKPTFAADFSTAKIRIDFELDYAGYTSWYY